LIIALKIAKMGYYGGNPENVLKARIDMVVSIMEYEKYTIDYENTYWELNKDDHS
jgi:hypothetical protein